MSTPTINNILFGDKGTDTILSTSTPINNTLFGGKHVIKKVPKYFPQVGQNIEDFDGEKIDITLDDYLSDKYIKIDDETKLEADFYNNIVPQQDVTDKKMKIEHNEVLEEFLRDAENGEELNKEIIADIIDPEVLSKQLADQDLFKRPLTPMGDKFDLENFFCRICDKKFPSCKSLKVHVSRSHNYLFPRPDKYRNKSHQYSARICEVCGEDVKSNYYRHVRKHVS